MSTKMTSSRPYFIRAVYEWILDNNCTPHIVVNAHLEGVRVPQQHVSSDGQIVLNIAPGAITDFFMDNHEIAFSARFGGVAQTIQVPCYAVMGIYARENGRGMMFEHEDPPPPTPKEPTPKGPAAVQDIKTGKRPGLRVVK